MDVPDLVELLRSSSINDESDGVSQNDVCDAFVTTRSQAKAGEREDTITLAKRLVGEARPKDVLKDERTTASQQRLSHCR